MNTYQVQCVIPRPVERVQAEHSFAARKAYAARHGVEFTDCFARRVWEDGTVADAGEGPKVRWPRQKPIRNVPSLDKYTG